MLIHFRRFRSALMRSSSDCAAPPRLLGLASLSVGDPLLLLFLECLLLLLDVTRASFSPPPNGPLASMEPVRLSDAATQSRELCAAPLLLEEEDELLLLELG